MGENEGYGGGDSAAIRVEMTASKSSWAFSSANAFLTSLGSALNWTDQEKSCLRMNQEQSERVFLAPDLNQALSWQLETHTPLVFYCWLYQPLGLLEITLGSSSCTNTCLTLVRTLIWNNFLLNGVLVVDSAISFTWSGDWLEASFEKKLILHQSIQGRRAGDRNWSRNRVRGCLEPLFWICTATLIYCEIIFNQCTAFNFITDLKVYFLV